MNILQQWFEEVWNKGDESAIERLSTPDIVAHDLIDTMGRPISGRAAFRVFWRDFRSAFPDIHIKVEDALQDGDKCVVRCTATGTHRGPGIGIAATNRPMRFTGLLIARIENGQMAEVWECWDFLRLYQQLGVASATLA